MFDDVCCVVVVCSWRFCACGCRYGSWGCLLLFDVCCLLLLVVDAWCSLSQVCFWPFLLVGCWFFLVVVFWLSFFACSLCFDVVYWSLCPFFGLLVVVVGRSALFVGCCWVLVVGW